MAVAPKLAENTAAQAMAANEAGSIGKLKRDCPQTGGVLSTLPEYIRSPQASVGCLHGGCLRKQSQWELLRLDKESAKQDRKLYVAAFSKDAARVVEAAGIHCHTASCYKYESGREKDGKPEHCRFGFTHFVTNWCWKVMLRRGKEVKVAVQRVFARFGKDPALPHGYEVSATEAVEGLKPTADMFAHQHPALGSQINARDSSDRPGRINTVRLHPRETSTLVGGIVVHRGNLDYQDLRTVLDDPNCDDVQLPLEIKVHRRDAMQECRAFCRHIGVALPRSALLRSLRSCMMTVDLAALARCRRAFFWQCEPRAGKAELPRVGDRQRDVASKRFTRSVVDGIVEAMRSATQIGFYICDYSTKPNVTTGRVLQHMHRGMKRLESELQEKEHVRKVLEMEAAGVLHDPGRLVAGQEIEVKTATLSEVEARQDKVRRILTRLWSAANYSLLKGSSLQLVHLLTRREAVRTHRYWQVLTKRLVWAGHGVQTWRLSGYSSTFVACFESIVHAAVSILGPLKFVSFWRGRSFGQL